jgi:hypothetical protein
LAELGIDLRRVKMPAVDPRHVREIFGLTQAEFADRFHAPDPSARLLLKVIEEYPQVIEAILGGTPPSKKEHISFGREGDRRRRN